MSSIVERLEKLSLLPGVSGEEHAVREAIRWELDGKCDKLEEDALGNLLVFKKGAAKPNKPILLSAHMDEVGFIITSIEDDGLLHFATVGGIDNRVIIGKAVEVGSKATPGVIGSKAIHMTEEKERAEAVSPDKLYIDIGAKDKAEAEALVQPGDRAVFSAKFTRFGDGMILGRAFDDRAGCAMLMELILTGDLAYDTWFAFTVQEETGCTGGKTAGYTVAPGISIVVETTTASDIGGVTPDKQVCALGSGAVISFMDRGTIYDRGLYQLALETAKAKGLPCQSKAGIFGGNESKAIQVSRSGVRTIAISLPCRYLHTPSNMLKISDMESTCLLLQEMIGATGTL